MISVAAEQEFTSDVKNVVIAYGKAWQQQDKKAIGALFTEGGEYCERPFHPFGTYRGREAIERYWERQIIMKQKDIEFEAKEEDYVIDYRQGKALVKWHASFANRLAYTKNSSEMKRVEFIQVAILTFNNVTTNNKPEQQHEGKPPLISRLEEYWHSSGQKGKSGDVAEEGGKTPITKEGASAARASEVIRGEENQNTLESGVENVKSRVAKKKSRRMQAAFAIADAVEGSAAMQSTPSASGLKEHFHLSSATSMTSTEVPTPASLLVPTTRRFSCLSEDGGQATSLCRFWLGYCGETTTDGNDGTSAPLLAQSSRMIAYFEVAIDSDSETVPSIGLVLTSTSPTPAPTDLTTAITRIWQPSGTVVTDPHSAKIPPLAVGQTTFFRGDTVGIGWDACTQKLFLTKNGELRNGLTEVIHAPGVFDLCPVVRFSGKGSVVVNAPDCCTFKVPFLLQQGVALSHSSPPGGRVMMTLPEMRESLLGEKTRVTLMENDLPGAVVAKNGAQLASIWIQILLKEGEKKGAKTLRFWCVQNKALVEESGAVDIIAVLLSGIRSGVAKRSDEGKGVERSK